MTTSATRKPKECRPIRCDQTGQAFPSIMHAARALNVHAPNVTSHLNGSSRYSQVSGYTFTDIPADQAPKPEPRKIPGKGRTKAKPIKCNETDQVFRSIRHAAASLGLHASSISMHLSRKPHHNKVRGYTFSYIS